MGKVNKIKTEKTKKKDVSNKPVELKGETAVKIFVLGESNFDGSILGFLLWKILGIIVTIITFGLAYPFALCMSYNYRIKHTSINDKRLKFDGYGYQLLGSWIFYWLLIIITFGLFIIFIPYIRTKWLIKHTHFEDYKKETDTDDNNKSKFTGNFISYFGWSCLGIFITIFSFGILFPAALCLMDNYKISHTVYDGQELEFSGNVWSLFLNWIKWIVLSIITLGIYTIILKVSIIKWEVKHTNKKGLVKEKFNIKETLTIPLIISLIIMIITIPILSNILSGHIDKLKERFEYIIPDEIYTGQDWGNKYAVYLKHNIFDKVDQVKVAIVNIDDNKHPEMVINYKDKKEDIYRLLYMENKIVNISKPYKNSTLTILYSVDTEEYNWYFYKLKNIDSGVYIPLKKLLNSKSSLKNISYHKDNQKFSNKYITANVNVKFQTIRKDNINNDMSDLVGSYEGDNYITYEMNENARNTISSIKEKLKGIKVGNNYLSYGVYKFDTSQSEKTKTFAEDDEVLELKEDGGCHYSRSSKVSKEENTDCTYELAEGRYYNQETKAKDPAFIIKLPDGMQISYQVSVNNRLSDGWHRLILKK